MGGSWKRKVILLKGRLGITWTWLVVIFIQINVKLNGIFKVKTRTLGIRIKCFSTMPSTLNNKIVGQRRA